MAATGFIGYALTIAGCPYIFTTGNISGVTGTDPLWFGAETGAQIADGWLFWPDFEINEVAQPLDGVVDVDGIRPRLHDAVINSGPAAGQSLFTWLATQDISNIPSTLLTATISETATTIPVGNGSIFTTNSFAWIEQECVRITAIAGNNLTVTRGRLGTKAVRHQLATDQGIQPEVFTRFPWAVRRRVVLWLVAPNLQAKPIWLGAAGNAPDLANDGLTFELPCDPLWNMLAQETVGPSRSTVILSGASGHDDYIFWSFQHIGGENNSLMNRITRFESVDLAAQDLVTQVANRLSLTPGITTGSAHGFFRRDGTKGIFTYDFDTGVAPSEIDGKLRAPSDKSGGAPREVAAEVMDRGSNRRVMTYTLDPCPQVAYRVRTYGPLDTFGVRSSVGFDSTYTATTSAPAGRTLRFQKGLKTALTDDFDVTFFNITSAADGRSFTAQCGLVAKKAGLTTRDPNILFPWIIDPGPLQTVLSVSAEHWADGLRYAIIPQVTETQDADWDWTKFEALVSATRGVNTSRNWLIDGNRTLGQLLAEPCLLNGCSLGTRGGKLCLIAWQLPTAGAAPAATFTSADLLGDVTHWETWKEGFANSITLSSDIITVNIQDDRSVRRYGRGRAMAVTMEGVEVDRLRSLEPGDLYRQLISRLGLWSSPVSIVDIPITLARALDVYMGDTIQVTEWGAPDGAGGRGLKGDYGIVLGRKLDLSGGVLVLRTLLFRRLAYGYAPCVKARQSVPISATEAQLEFFPVRNTEDYAGSVAAGLNDAGSSKFTIGAKVRAILRDSTTYFGESLTISDIYNDGTYWVFKFTSAMSGTLQGYLNTNWIDFVLDTYSTATTQEKNWGWVGSESTSTIGGTSDPAQKIAP